MKSLRVAAIPALLVLCVGMALGQDAAHDVDKGATRTRHFVNHAERNFHFVLMYQHEDYPLR